MASLEACQYAVLQETEAVPRKRNGGFDVAQSRTTDSSSYSRHMPSGRVCVLFGFFSGPGGRASSEDTCPMGGWADGFLNRAPVGVARFYEKLPRAKFPVLKELKILPNSLALFVR